MDYLDTLIVGKPASIASGEVPVWNGSAWARSSVTRIGVSSLGSGSPSASNFLRGDGTWATPSTAVNFATTLPGSPTNGDETILVDSTSAPTYQWRFRYNSTSAKWEFIGGTPAFAEVTTDQATSSATYVALTTAGPSFTVPVAGDYIVEIGFHHGATTTGTDVVLLMSYDIGGTGAVDADAAYGATRSKHSVSRPRKQTGLAASTALVAKYKSDGTNSNSFQDRWMMVTPVRVS